MKKIYTFFAMLLVSVTCMAADITLTATKYSYNQWNTDQQGWYVAFATADGAYSVRLLYEVADLDFPSPYGHVLTEAVDLERSYINATSADKTKYLYDSVDLQVARTEAGQMAISGTIVSGETTFTLQTTGDGLPVQERMTEYQIEASQGILLSTEYVHPGMASLFMGCDKTTGDSLILCVVGEKAEGDFATYNATISTKHTKLFHADGTSATLFGGIASVSREGDLYTVDASLLFDDCCLYLVSMTYRVAAGETFEITCTNTLWTDYCHTFGAAWAQASDEHFVNILVEMGNLFDLAPCQLDQTYFKVEMWREGDPDARPSVTNQTTIVARLEQQDDKLVLIAELVGNDNNYYKLDMRYNRPEPKQTVELTVENAEFFNAVENGYFQVSGYTPDQQHWVSLLIMSQEIEGTFTLDGNTLQKDYTMVWEAATDTEKLLQWGEAVFTLDADSTIMVDAQLLTQDSVLYLVKMTSHFDKPHLSYDCQDQGVEHTFGSDTQNEMRYYELENGNIYLELTMRDKKTKTICQLGFWVGGINDTYYLGAGTYDIDRSGDVGTLQASSGVVNGGVNASFIGGYDGDSIVLPIWFFDRGTAVVTNQNGYLDIEVTALNSYDQEILIHFSDRVATALDNISIPANHDGKRLEGGRVVIERNGVRYDLKGRVVKG